MTKTLRITCVAAAALVAVLLVFPAIFGFRSDQKFEKFLQSPSVIDEFKQAKGGSRKRTKAQISPLVKQATAFAGYLNPPKPHREPRPANITTDGKPPPPPPPRTKPRFQLIATSYNETRPAESVALIEAPGKGLYWVRQSEQVGHLTVEIKDGIVVAKSNNDTFEVAVQHIAPKPLVIGPSTGLPSPGPVPALRSPGTGSNRSSDADVRSSIPTQKNIAEQMSIEEQREMAEKIFAELETVKGSKSSKVDSVPRADTVDRPSGSKVFNAEPPRITGKEAEQLGRLGKKLDEKAESARERAKELRESRLRRIKELHKRRMERAKSTKSSQD